MLYRVALFFALTESLTAFAQDTELKFYRPFNESNMAIQKKIAGQCWQQSQRIKREDAWRCLAEGRVYDPCFVKQYGSKQEVLCPQSPWVAVSIQINSEASLDNSAHTPLDMSRAYPWAIELTSGEKCQAVDEGQSYDNLPVRYECNTQTVLLGHVQRCKAEWSILQRKADGVSTAMIAKAWF